MVPFDKGTNHFLIELNGAREADGFASQSLDARSERQVDTLDTLGGYLPGQMHLARNLSCIASPVIAGDKTNLEWRKQAQQPTACPIVAWVKCIGNDSFSFGIKGIPKPMSMLCVADIGPLPSSSQISTTSSSTTFWEVTCLGVSVLGRAGQC